MLGRNMEASASLLGTMKKLAFQVVFSFPSELPRSDATSAGLLAHTCSLLP